MNMNTHAMEPQRDPLCYALDQPGQDHPHRLGQLDCTTDVALEGRARADSGEGNGAAASSSPESGSLNGDGERGGKRQRRRKRPSRSESQSAGKEGQPARGPSQALLGLQAESVWFHRSVYEQAESAYQRWLASSVDGTAAPLSPTPEERPAQPEAPPVADCRHGDWVACHHVVESVWVNRSAFEAAERRFMEKASLPPATAAAPSSLALPPSRSPPAAHRTPDEGYLSLTPTPATPCPLTPQRRSINGLPGFPCELLRWVWVEKPLFDRAEAAYYQNLCSQLLPSASTPAPAATATPAVTPTTTPTPAATATPTVAPTTAATPVPTPTPGENEGHSTDSENGAPEAAADALSPPPPATGDRARPAEDGGQAELRCFLHPDSERAWLDGPRFEAAERHFHEMEAAAGVDLSPSVGPTEGDLAAPSSPCPDVDVIGLKAESPASLTCSSCDSLLVAACCVIGKRRAVSLGRLQRARICADRTMSGVEYLAQEKIWFDKFRYDEAERHFYERMNGPTHTPQETGANTILQDIARARENIQKSLAGMKTTLQPGKGRSRTPQNRRGQSGAVCGAGDQGELITRMKSLELENQNLHKVVEDLRSALSKLESRVAVLEKRPAAAPAPAPAAAAAPCAKAAPVVQPKVRAPVEEDDDDDLDLFGSDEDEDEEAERIREQRVKEYTEKKAKKPALIAKSSILLDVKPWDDETDMVKLEECVRSVQADGLLWGSSKLVPVGYGIKKLQIQCVVEDDKVGTDMLEEEITKFEDYVQSVDVAAFNKI
ncbi:eukaryotic translation elongation factor 1 delta b (guanine nucleotide exchange protein) [Megalops cyprinoides]|uniref:eukaryotic translation elongation factor 1 delta b (guanine nucleotide exchange protein) n=1 Tax=Megalops cyprinoides TaxID=118141 RepID=UPI001864F525|nr:eukaryotic translation elongation factor 1 delta b (guanine nucleotide exchange protein) [Megalops cyprinoides]